MQFTVGDEREVHLWDESVLPVTEKERKGEGKNSIAPRINTGLPQVLPELKWPLYTHPNKNYLDCQNFHVQPFDISSVQYVYLNTNFCSQCTF